MNKNIFWKGSIMINLIFLKSVIILLNLNILQRLPKMKRNRILLFTFKFNLNLNLPSYYRCF